MEAHAAQHDLNHRVFKTKIAAKRRRVENKHAIEPLGSVDPNNSTPSPWRRTNSRIGLIFWLENCFVNGYWPKDENSLEPNTTILALSFEISGFLDSTDPWARLDTRKPVSTERFLDGDVCYYYYYYF